MCASCFPACCVALMSSHHPTHSQLRRLPALAKLHEWLVQGNLYGSINRQEAVSMVPPLFLDVQPHHVVLDMCAAPGSKTSQLLEALHAPVAASDAVPATNGLPTGCVVANDADLARCNMLTHQLKRAASPALIVINHDAGRLPAPRNPATGEALSYDRILADVPCTGDGTLRKAPDLWRKWHLHMAVGIHPLQLSIATRGAAMLRTGGRMVYSTCSLNPLEDEAVVAALLRQTKGALRLVDTTGMLPALRRSAGKSHWLVLDKSGERSSPVPPPGSKGLKTLVQSMWPPASQEEAEAMALHRCMRFLPHHGDTGGFFVAVLEKVSDWPLPTAQPAAGEAAAVAADADAGGDEDAAEEEDEEVGAAVDAPAPDGGEAGGDAGPAPVEAGQAGQQQPGNTSRQRRAQRVAIDPVTEVTDDWILSTVQSFYGFGPTFPLRGTLYMRLGDVEQSREAGFSGRPKRLYAVAPGAAAGLAGDTKRRLKIMSAGVKLFEKGHDAASKAVCPYRISQEGLHWVLPHMTAQVATIHLHQLARLVRRRMLFFETPSHAGEAPPMLDAAAIQALAAMAQGCIVILPFLPAGCGAGADTTAEDLAVVAWKGSVSVALLVNKQESPILLQRLDALCDPQEVALQKSEAALADSNKRGKATAAAAEKEAAAE